MSANQSVLLTHLSVREDRFRYLCPPPARPGNDNSFLGVLHGATVSVPHAAW